MSNSQPFVAVPHGTPDNGDRYLLELTARERFNIAAALGAFKILGEKVGIEFPEYAKQELVDMREMLINAELININDESDLDDDLVDLNDLERQALLTGLSLLVVGLTTGKIVDDIGITPRVVSTLGKKLLGIEEDA